MEELCIWLRSVFPENCLHPLPGREKKKGGGSFEQQQVNRVDLFHWKILIMVGKSNGIFSHILRIGFQFIKPCLISRMDYSSLISLLRRIRLETAVSECISIVTRNLLRCACYSFPWKKMAWRGEGVKAKEKCEKIYIFFLQIFLWSRKAKRWLPPSLSSTPPKRRMTVETREALHTDISSEVKKKFNGMSLSQRKTVIKSERERGQNMCFFSQNVIIRQKRSHASKRKRLL